MIDLFIKEKKFDKTILENIRIEFEQDKVYGLIGLNGSGKTTLINILLGLDTEFEGQIDYNELIKNNDIFYIPSDFYIPEYLTGEEYCNYLHDLRNKKLNEEAFDTLCDLFKLDKKKLINHYSYGMKKKIQFITGLLLKVKVYVFDELTSGLDIETIMLIEKVIMSKNATYIISSHELDFIERISDFIFLLDNKNIKLVDNDIRKKLADLSKIEDHYEKIKDSF